MKNMLLCFIALSFIVETGCGVANFNADSNKRAELNVRKAIVQTAESFIGTKYKYGGKSPSGFDCSGFTRFVYDKFQYRLGPSSKIQAKEVKTKAISKLKIGDLIFFSKRNKINHVAIVKENSSRGLFVIHSTSSSGVRIDEISRHPYWKKRIAKGGDILSK